MRHRLTRRVLSNGHKAGYNIVVNGEVVGIVYIGYYHTWTARKCGSTEKVIGVTRHQAVERLLKGTPHDRP